MTPSRLVWLLAAVGLGLSCSSYETVRCSVDSDCGGFPNATCDTAAGVCVVGVLDAGSLGDAGDGSAAACTDSSQCGGTTPICGAGGTCRGCGVSTQDGDGECTAKGSPTPTHCQMSGECMGCTTAGHDCSGAMPICGANFVCRGCISNDECDSKVCDNTVCVDPTTIAYVDKGMCGGAKSGAQTAPYCEIIDAIAGLGSRSVIRVAPSGTAYGPISVSTGNVRIVGPGIGSSATAVIQGGSSMTSPVTVKDTGNLILDGFEITDAANVVNGGVYCTSVSTPATVTVVHSNIHNLFGPGVAANNCKVTVDKSKISYNSGGGIILFTGTFSITNDFIFSNGNAGPGVSFGSATELVLGNGFVHNTVADNGRTAGMPAGVVCTSNVSLVGSILVNNQNGNQQNCSSGNGSFIPSSAGGVDFMNSVAGDYRLVPETGTGANVNCCIDKVTTNPLAVDFFGTKRPIGLASDTGAHEVQ